MYTAITRDYIDKIYYNKWSSDEDKEHLLYTMFVTLSESFIEEEKQLAAYVEDLLDTL